jgi:hypothetical protein
MRWWLIVGCCFLMGCSDAENTEDTGPSGDASSLDVSAPDLPSPPDTAGPSPTGPKAMIAIHADPNGPKVDRATSENWVTLVDLLIKADSFGFKLTLLMSSDWADIIQPDPVRRKVLKGWIGNGHQLGFHHHTCGHNSPDGYRDVADGFCKGAEDRGSVALAFAKVKDLGETVDIAAQGPNTNGIYRAAEWQPDAIYATGEMAENGDGHDHRFITVPRCTNEYGNSYGGTQVTYAVPEIGHSQLDVGNFIQNQSQNNRAALETDINLMLGKEHTELGVHIGIVFHAREYADTPRGVERDNYATDKSYLDAISSCWPTKEWKWLLLESF